MPAVVAFSSFTLWVPGMLRSGEFIRGCVVVEKRASELVTSICYTVSKLDSACFESILWAYVLHSGLKFG